MMVESMAAGEAVSGFQNAVGVGHGVIVIPRTCDGGGAWECANPVQPGHTLCPECEADE